MATYPTGKSSWPALVGVHGEAAVGDYFLPSGRLVLNQLSAIGQELEEAKQAVMESEKKLKFKEETAAAAMEARDAAEKSLRLADLRASRLRDRVEELTHQLEESDAREDSRKSRNRPRYVYWPWEWFGLTL